MVAIKLHYFSLAGRYNPGHDNPDILPGQTLKDFTADFYAAQFNYKSEKFDANAMYAVMTNIENTQSSDIKIQMIVSVYGAMLIPMIKIK